MIVTENRKRESKGSYMVKRTERRKYYADTVTSMEIQLDSEMNAQFLRWCKDHGVVKKLAAGAAVRLLISLPDSVSLWLLHQRADDPLYHKALSEVDRSFRAMLGL